VIAKRVLTPKGGSGYQRLSGYVLNVRQEHREAIDPASWTRLGAYVLDTPHAGEKVAWARATNCGHDDPGWAVKHILSVQEQNTRSKSDKSYHLVVSFPEGERPTRAQMEDIEDRLCEALGFGEHQRVSAVHQNTDNWHLHVAINKVHPVTLRNVTPVRDHFRLQAACLELEIRHGLTQEPHTVDFAQSRERRARGRAADFEARHGGRSFLTWIQEHARPALLEALQGRQGWQGMHQVAAAHDLDLKLRGAGLVISHRGDSRLHVKASDVDRGLSRKTMTDRLGPFEPPGVQAQGRKPDTRYERPARAGEQYDAFQRERERSVRARDAAMADLVAQQRAYGRELASWYRQRLRQERTQGQRGALRRDSLQHIAAEREKDRKARVEREREERRQLRAAHPIPNWQSYLEAEAAKGNEQALASLRLRQRRNRHLEREILTAENAEQARHIVHGHMKPAIRRDGRVIYRVADGGMVTDEAAHVRVPQPTVAATLLALSLASERFGNRPLIVKGTEAFRSQLAAVAALQDMAVTFADPALERQKLSRMKAVHTDNQERGGDRDSGRGR
jgi:hypothetical protein